MGASSMTEAFKVYTSNFAKLNRIHDQFVVVRIMVAKPKYTDWEYEELPVLYPDWNTMVQPFLSGIISEEEYTKRYNEQLSNLNKEDIIQQLEQLSEKHGGKPVCLACNCAKGKFCHRYLIAKWLGCDTEEL